MKNNVGTVKKANRQSKIIEKVKIDTPSNHNYSLFPIRHPVGSYVGYFFRRLYIYVWKLNQTVLELDFRAVKFFVLPSTGFELTPLIHCSTIRLALRPAS